MKRVCAWCGREMEPGQGGQNAPITHGICLSCMRRVLNERSSSLPEFLENLEAPVIVVDAEAVVQEANLRAYALLDKDRTHVAGHRAGEIIECAYAHLPGGCGSSEHCRTGCVIRRSVTLTHSTGQAVEGIMAEQEIETPQGVRRQRFLISTERAGELVLLRIDEVK